MHRCAASAIVFALLSMAAPAAEPKPLKLLFLGDDGHHRPAERYRQLAPALAPRKIDLVYTDKADVAQRQDAGRRTTG